MHSRKAQTGIEVLVMAGIVLVLSAIVMFALNERSLNVEAARQQLSAQKETERLAFAINSAAIGGKGFQTNITVSKKAGSQDADLFRVYSKGRKVEMRWQGPRNQTLVASSRLVTSGVKETDVATAKLLVNNTGTNVEVKCWNSGETDVQNC